MKIGIFDSGRGGELIASGIKPLLPPTYEYMVVNDREHVPYGSRTNTEIIELAYHALAPLIDAQCDIIVIACNTATMAGIETLRTRHPGILFVGTEPMIKPADTMSISGRIIVLGTPLTVQSHRYRLLKQKYASGITVSEPDTSSWAAKIEYGESDTIDFSEISRLVAHGSDVIVLACTHYLALKNRFRSVFPDVQVLEPTNAIARQILRLTGGINRWPTIDQYD